MAKLKLVKTKDVESVLKEYPKHVQKKLKALRQLILKTAEETEGISEIEETLKWGEPSYLVNNGSTVRFDWKEKKPNQYAIYFKCTSKLVETFKEIYPDEFNYETTRAMVFQMDDAVPELALKECIRMALCYHKLKHLPLLGAGTD